MRVAVFGLGYVGCVSSACFAGEGHKITGVDVIQEKVDIINAARSPIVEPGLEEKIVEGVQSGRLTATTDFKQAVLNSDMSLICVPTPSQKNGSVSLEYIYRVAEQIGQALDDLVYDAIGGIRPIEFWPGHSLCIRGLG